MTDEKIEKGQDLQHQIAHFKLQERKLTEAINLIQGDMNEVPAERQDGENGANFHAHLIVYTKGIVKTHTSWSFNHNYWLDMLRPLLETVKTKISELQKQFDEL
jgi:hypothetical protein